MIAMSGFHQVMWAIAFIIGVPALWLACREWTGVYDSEIESEETTHTDAA